LQGVREEAQEQGEGEKNRRLDVPSAPFPLFPLIRTKGDLPQINLATPDPIAKAQGTPLILTILFLSLSPYPLLLGFLLTLCNDLSPNFKSKYNVYVTLKK
jgi:hypothetical protein